MNEKKNFNINISTKGFTVTLDENKEYIDIEGYASRMLDDKGNPLVDLEQEYVKTTYFELLAKRLLLNHNLEEPCGDLELTHRPDGIFIKARAYKDTMETKEFNRLRRGLYSFSIGFTVDDYEFNNYDGQDILTFTKGVVYEVSLVAIPANPHATIDSMKSFNKDGCFGISCDLENLKSMNPDKDCGCKLNKEGKSMDKEKDTKVLKDFNKETILALVKGLTIEDTMNESWNISDDFWRMFDYFNQTLEDNWDEFRWSDSHTKEEMLANIQSAFEAFKVTIENTAQRIEEKSLGGNSETQNKTKSVGEEVKEETVTETPNDTSNESEPDTESKETESNEEEVKEETVTEPTEVKTNEVEETKEKPNEIPETESKEEVNSTDNKEEVSAEPSLRDTLSYISKIDLNNLELEDIEVLYNNASEIKEKIEEIVKQDLQES